MARVSLTNSVRNIKTAKSLQIAAGNLLADKKGLHQLAHVVVWVIHLCLYIYFLKNFPSMLWVYRACFSSICDIHYVALTNNKDENIHNIESQTQSKFIYIAYPKSNESFLTVKWMVFIKPYSRLVYPLPHRLFSQEGMTCFWLESPVL